MKSSVGLPVVFKFKMAAEARREARRKRILENSGERLQKIIDSQNSPSKLDKAPIDRPTFEFQTNDFSETSENIPKKESTLTDFQVEGHFSPSASTLNEEIKNENQSYISKSTKQKTSEATEVKESLNTGWIRLCFNVFLGVFLVVVSKREDNTILQYFFGPWIALQIFMFSVPLLRQELSPKWLSVFKVALQLCGIPANYTSVLNTVYIFVVPLLLDFPLFIFTTVMTMQILELLTGR